MNDYSKYYPKPRTGNECKKTERERHKDYIKWNPLNSDLKFCRECKHAHVSQYKAMIANTGRNAEVTK